jgi:putative addiction module killer protein
MFSVTQTEEFRDWLLSLKDRTAARKIAQRIVRLQSGLMGDAKFFDGIGELRVDYGPGYRVYFVRSGATLIILLCGGNKSTQQRDITRAKAMAKEI